MRGRRQRGFYNLPFSPESINGLVLWADARAVSYSSTTGGAAEPPAGRVRRLEQASPVGRWLAASDLVRPIKESATTLSFQAGAGLSLSQPAAITLPSNGATLAVSATLRDPGYSANFACFGTDSAGSWGWGLFNGQLLIYREGGAWFTGVSFLAAAYPDTGILVPFSFVARFTATGCNVSWSCGAASGTAAEANTLASRTVSGITIGTGGGEQFHGAVTQQLGYNVAVSDASVETLLEWLKSQPAPAAFPVNAPLVVIAGDSIARGFSIARASNWPFTMLSSLYAIAPARLLNTAISGDTIAQQTIRYAANVAPHFSASRAKNILVAAMGTNSLATGSGLTPAQCLTQYWAYCDTARAAGWKVIAQTVSPRTDAPFGDPPYEANRLTYNTLVRAQWATHADAFVDVGALAGMSLPTDCVGANFLADRVHWSVAGNALQEPGYRAAVISLL